MKWGVVRSGRTVCECIPEIWSMACGQYIPNTNNSRVSIINKENVKLCGRPSAICGGAATDLT